MFECPSTTGVELKIDSLLVLFQMLVLLGKRFGVAKRSIRGWIAIEDVKFPAFIMILS